MTIEEFIIDYLDPLITGIHVGGSVPHPMPNEFVTVEKTGSRTEDLIDSATVAIQSWSTGRADAAALNERVKAAMAGLTALPQISRCALNSDYNYTDTTTKRSRYQAVYDVVYLF